MKTLSVRGNYWALALALLLSFGVISYLAYAEENEEVQAIVEPTAAELGYFEAFILGLVEGATEYLPVSSTGHLILTNRILGLDDTSGNPELKKAADAYAIVIQGGAILAVLALYHRRIRQILAGVLGQSKEGMLLARNIVVAFMPAAVLGLLLDDLIESYLFGPWPVVFALAVGACFMLAVEQWRKGRATALEDLHDMSWRQALVVGFLQCVAMWPGTSRSMMTIVGGYWVGLNTQKAAEFSFLLGLLTLTAASGYKALSNYEVLKSTVELGPLLFGIFVATLAAGLSVKWLVAWLSKHGFFVFAVYRIVLAAVIASWILWLQ